MNFRPFLVEWFPMELAPKNAEILVYCPPKQGLPELFSRCKWHPDAGFCVDEVRRPVAWTWLPAQAPPNEE